MKREKKQRKEKAPRRVRRRSFRSRQQTSSIFFLLWTVFSLFALCIVIGCSVGQQYVVKRSYKDQAAHEVSEKGATIARQVTVDPPSTFGQNDVNGYIRYLSRTYDVDIYILDGTGRLLFPQDFSLQPSTPEYEQYYDLSKKWQRLEKELDGQSWALYEGEGEYVYGAKISLYSDAESYVYVGKSLQLMETSLARMTSRTVLLSVFVFIFAFAVSCAAAGWLVNPLSELTEKAHKLAQGDFGVDFHGKDYGRELVELAESLNYARDELSKTDRMQKELIANVSHDFKTPLTMIKGYASMIMEISGDIPEKRNKHAQIIVDETDRLTSLVSDLLDLSKIRSGLAQLEETQVDMSAYVREILGRFDYLKDTQGYQFEVDIEEGLTTYADKLKLGQALYNLIGNAVNYTGEDKKVYVSLKREGEYFRFAVRDTGVGISQEELGEIWDRYYRSSQMHKRPVNGTGLGLSIVKSILDRQGFAYGVESELGKGSTFYVLFSLVK